MKNSNTNQVENLVAEKKSRNTAKTKKVVETTNFVNLMQEIQKFLQEEAKKLEEKGLLPKPTPPMFYINYAKKTLTMNFYYEKQ